jgi:shikimate kinase
MSVKKNLVLLGMMGVGKSTLGRIVAKKQDLEFIDTDSNIERKCSMKILEIFEKKGEKFFRIEEEKEVLKSLKKNNCIIALGGGAFLNRPIRNVVLKKAVSVWLDLDVKNLNKRLKWNKKRPLLNEENNQKKIDKLYLERKNIYKLANHRIDCKDLDKEDIVEKIINLYEEQ